MLEHFFGSKTRLKLLKLFFRLPQRCFYVREISRLIETQLNGVRREIDNLEKMEIIIPAASDAAKNSAEPGTGRSKYYQLNTASLLYPELKALLVKADLLEERQLVEEIKQRGGQIKLLMLTGIFTHDDSISTDMVVVGKLKQPAIARLIHSHEEILGKTVRYTLMEEKEFKDRREIGDKFLYALFESKHIMTVDEYRIG